MCGWAAQEDKAHTHTSRVPVKAVGEVSGYRRGRSRVAVCIHGSKTIHAGIVQSRILARTLRYGTVVHAIWLSFFSLEMNVIALTFGSWNNIFSLPQKVILHLAQLQYLYYIINVWWILEQGLAYIYAKVLFSPSPSACLSGNVIKPSLNMSKSWCEHMHHSLFHKTVFFLVPP